MAAHRRPWRAVEESGQINCIYCRRPFSADVRPTFDHVIPIALGGSTTDGLVLACHSCNSARGDIPFPEYMAAVEAEWAAAERECRAWRRPKRIDLPGGRKIVFVGSKKERRARCRQAARDITA